MHNALNPIAATVMQLLLEHGPDAASAYISQELVPAMEAAQKIAAQASSDVAMAQNLIAFTRAASPPAAGNTTSLGRVPTQSEGVIDGAMREEPMLLDKRTAVMNTADELSSADFVTTEDVEAALASKGIVLPGERPRTSIGNILSRAPGWKRVSEGRFTKIATNVQHSIG